MTKMFVASTSVFALAVLSMGGISTSARADITSTAIPPSVLVFDQKLQDDQVLVKYAILQKNGYVVIFGSDKDGKPLKEAIGHVELKAGDHRDVMVKVGPLAPLTHLWASIHSDSDAKPGFDKAADATIWRDGLPLGNRFVIR